MGGGIAMNFANAGIPVTVLEVSQEGLDRGLGVVRKNFTRTRPRRVAHRCPGGGAHGLIKGTLTYEELKDADPIVEAVLRRWRSSRKCSASSTMSPSPARSSRRNLVPVDRRDRGFTARPSDMVGMHFFSPANVMQLCEVVRGAQTSPEVLATALEVAKKIKKVGVVSGNSHGSSVTACSEVWLPCADPGARGRQDRAGRRRGPKLRHADGTVSDGRSGRARYRLQVAEGSRSVELRRASARVADALVELGRMGQKTQRWQLRLRPRRPHAQALAGGGGGYREPRWPRRSASSSASSAIKIFVERCFLPLFNVGCDVLEEGVALSLERHRHRLPLRLRLPCFPRRPDVLGGTRGGPEERSREDLDNTASWLATKWTRPSPLLERLVARGQDAGEPGARLSPALRTPRRRRSRSRSRGKWTITSPARSSLRRSAISLVPLATSSPSTDVAARSRRR